MTDHPVAGLRVALIGAGGIAHAHLPAWLELGADVLVFALEGTERLITNCGGGRACRSLDEALAGAEVADVSVPTFAHRTVVEQVVAGGIDKIFCEKPLGRTAADARAMIETCTAAGARLYPGHVVRYFPEYALMHDRVANGAVGELAVQRFSRTGSRPRMPWYHDPELSGGIVLDQMIHDFDFACWNAGPVATVFARLRRTGTPESGLDAAHVVLTHVSGAISYVTGTWARTGTEFQTTFEIAGTDGLLRHDSTEHRAVRIDTGAPDPEPDAGERAGTGLLPDDGGMESPFLTELREVATAFRTGTEPRVSAADGLYAVILAEAANRSIAEGRAIAVDAAEVPTTSPEVVA